MILSIIQIQYSPRTSFQIFSVALAVNACVSTKFGWGKHLDEVPTSNFGPILLFIWLSELLFTLSTTLVKISILFFYLRIAVTATYRRIIYASIAFIAAWAIAFSAVVIFVGFKVRD
jgi:hypothetical protein